MFRAQHKLTMNKFVLSLFPKLCAVSLHSRSNVWCTVLYVLWRTMRSNDILNFYAFRFIFFFVWNKRKRNKYKHIEMKETNGSDKRLSWYSHYFNTNRWAQIHASLLTLNSIYKINFVRTLPTSIYLYFHEKKNKMK